MTGVPRFIALHAVARATDGRYRCDARECPFTGDGAGAALHVALHQWRHPEAA